ncbi:sulfatase [Coraliomargarita sp. W4R72]
MKFLFLVSLVLSVCPYVLHASRPMNVVMILADDLGWSDTTLYGTTKLYQTPNLERLAERGMTFTRAYSASPLCSPTRASILTGQTPARNGHTSPQHHLKVVRLQPELESNASPSQKTLNIESKTRLETDLPTLGKLLRKGGYRTGHFGKWHLGYPPYSPLEHGFEVDIPHHPGPGPAGNFVAPWSFANIAPQYPGEHIEDRMAAEAIAWMGEVADEPFYLQYWQFSVHAPFDAKEELIDQYRTRIDMDSSQRSPTYAAMVHSLDDAVGALLDEIDRLGIADKTVIIFFSDNGGNMHSGISEVDRDGKPYVARPTDNAPLRGGKATVYDGGIRVPMVVAWPGVTEAGSRNDALVQSTDFYPTILHLAGLTVPKDHIIDGVDFKSALRGEDFDRGPIFTYFPGSPPVLNWLPPAITVHLGEWKLIRIFHYGDGGGHAYRLYNLSDDIGEQNDLSQSEVERVKWMDALIEEHLQECGTLIPQLNPNFDPSKFRPERIGVQAGNGPNVGASREKRLQQISKLSSIEVPLLQAVAGWHVKPGETMGLRLKDEQLEVNSTGLKPWIRTVNVPSLNGPVLLSFEVKTSSGGEMRLFAGRDGKPFVAGSFEAVEVAPSTEWQSVSVLLPSAGRLSALRINMPDGRDITMLRGIRLEQDGQLHRSWF